MASSKIKGITIEIDGDTTKLGKALESAESASKGLQGELKGINTLLKLDPSNVELLTQKQKVLTDAINSTEEKLKTLKTAQAQVQAQFDKGEITEQQFRDFQREIIVTEQKLEGLKNQAKDFGSVFEQQVKEASKKVENLGSSIEDAGKKMAGVSTVASVGLVASAKSAADNEAAVNKYIASTGKAVSETEKYKNLMETIYKNNYGDSIEDVADKMSIVSNILGDLPDDELQRVVEKSYMLEDAYGMDFQENIRGVNAMMDQFGITADQAYELINQGAQKGLNQNQDLTDQIAEYSTYYAKLGFTAEDFFNIMIAGSEDGAYQIDYLNDAMKEFGIRTKDNSKSTNDAYSQLGLNVEEVNNKFAQGGEKAQEAFAEVTQAIMSIEDPVKRNEIGVALFGTKFEDLEESAIFAMSTAKDQVNMLGDTVDQTTDTMYGGTSAKAQEALRTIQMAFASLGESLLPIIAPIAEKIADLANKFSKLSPPIKKLIVIVGGIVAALAPITIIIGKVITAIGTIMPVIVKIGGLLAKAPVILGAIKTAIAAVVGALSWPVVAIAAVIAAIVLLWTKCQWFRDMVKELWEKIKIGFQAAVDLIKVYFDLIVQHFMFVWNSIKAIFDVVVIYFQTIFEAVKIVIITIWDSIVIYFKMVWENIKLIFSVVVDFFKTIFKTAWDSIKLVWNSVTGYFKTIWETIKGIFSVVKNVLTGNWKGAWEGIKGIVDKWKNYFKGIWEGIKSVFSNVASFFKNTFESAWQGIKNIFNAGGQIFEGIKEGIANVFKTIVNGLISGINTVIAIPFNTINGLLNDIRNINILGAKPFDGLWGQNPLPVPKIPKLSTGTNFVPYDEMPALLHKGEQVVPKKYNPEVNDKHLKNAVFDALTNFTNIKAQNTSNQTGIGELTKLMKQYMPLIIENMGQDIVLDDRTLVGKIAPRIDKQLGVISSNKSRGY